MIEMRTTSIDRQPSPPPCDDQLRGGQLELLHSLHDRVVFITRFYLADPANLGSGVRDRPDWQRYWLL